MSTGTHKGQQVGVLGGEMWVTREAEFPGRTPFEQRPEGGKERGTGAAVSGEERPEQREQYVQRPWGLRSAWCIWKATWGQWLDQGGRRGKVVGDEVDRGQLPKAVVFRAYWGVLGGFGQRSATRRHAAFWVYTVRQHKPSSRSNSHRALKVSQGAVPLTRVPGTQSWTNTAYRWGNGSSERCACTYVIALKDISGTNNRIGRYIT